MSTELIEPSQWAKTLTTDGMEGLKTLQPGVYTLETEITSAESAVKNEDIPSSPVKVVINKAMFSTLISIIKVIEAVMTENKTPPQKDNSPNLITRQIAKMEGVSVEQVTPDFVANMVREAEEAQSRDAELHGLKIVTSEELRARKRSFTFP